MSTSKIAMTSVMVQPVRMQPPEKVAYASSTVSKQFRPIILLLSTLSPYGISVKASKETGEISYEASKLSWKRPLSMYSLGLLLWIVFTFCIHIFNITWDIPFPIDLVTLKPPRNTSGEITLSLSTNRIILATVGFCRLLEFIGLFLSAPLLAKWLNELTAIEMAVNTHFTRAGAHMNSNITRLRNYLVLFYLIPLGGFWIVAHFWAFLSQHEFNLKYSALCYIWYVSIVFYLMTSELIEDTKMILMLETLRRIYSQMRSGIRQDVFHGEISETNVLAWDGLITKLHRHVKLTGECIKTQLLLNICETVVVVSVGTFMVIRSAGGVHTCTNIGFGVTAGFFCVVMSARFYTKVAIAESIYHEERLLGADLKDLEFCIRAKSPEALHELRSIVQSLTLVPSKIPIGNYFELDSKLSVQVVIQTIPMLIAVAQFHTL